MSVFVARQPHDAVTFMLSMPTSDVNCGPEPCVPVSYYYLINTCIVTIIVKPDKIFNIDIYICIILLLADLLLITVLLWQSTSL